MRWFVMERKRKLYDQRVADLVKWFGEQLLSTARQNIAWREEAWSRCRTEMLELERVLTVSCRGQSPC